MVKIGEIRMQLLTDLDLKDRFNEFLDECYGPIRIGFYLYDHGYALKKVDSKAYTEELYNWLNSELDWGTIKKIDGEYYETE